MPTLANSRPGTGITVELSKLTCPATDLVGNHGSVNLTEAGNNFTRIYRKIPRTWKTAHPKEYQLAAKLAWVALVQMGRGTYLIDITFTDASVISFTWSHS